MNIFIDAAKVSYFEDSINIFGKRKIEIIVDGRHLDWNSQTYDNTYLTKVSDFFIEALKKRKDNL